MTKPIGINFHGIGTPKRSLEPGEAPYWLSVGKFERVLDRIAADPDPNRFTITFDDSNLSDHDIALPALVTRGLRARFFVLTGRIGQAGSLDADHLRRLQNADMTIGSHGIDHLAWPTLDDAALIRELSESRAQLEMICGCPVVEAGIPFGRYDTRVLRALRDAGYTTAWSSDGGIWRKNAFIRPRTSLREDMSDQDLKAILSGHMPLARRFRRALGMTRRRWTTTG
ncbi:polysaccharide deacetylase family protein [Ruegeria sp. HKCCE3926]|uniref:polysaccharide deacetylase family protein n=1 Tax=Ruegeria sp. HKCCE3926 TaxID=2794831 RepID=UPI001AE54EC7|nr:polysaccharide deacetylase family protein [Ruegeria sp. HKCCE3926]